MPNTLFYYYTMKWNYLNSVAGECSLAFPIRIVVCLQAADCTITLLHGQTQSTDNSTNTYRLIDIFRRRSAEWRSYTHSSMCTSALWHQLLLLPNKRPLLPPPTPYPSPLYQFCLSVGVLLSRSHHHRYVGLLLIKTWSRAFTAFYIPIAYRACTNALHLTKRYRFWGIYTIHATVRSLHHNKLTSKTNYKNGLQA